MATMSYTENKRKHAAILERNFARRIYLEMPGANKPDRSEDGEYMWGDVEDTEEYHFCSAIAEQVRHYVEDVLNMHEIASHGPDMVRK
jgi:hypothetical protein